MNFCIIFWNIWLDNQIDGENSEAAKKLLSTLDDLVELHNPDCIGLNEVLATSKDNMSFVVEHLKKRGYPYSSFVASGPWTDKLTIGDAIFTKNPLLSVKKIPLGRHLTVSGMAASEHPAGAILAEVSLSETESIHVIVAHLMHLRPNSLSVHFEHQKSLTEFINSFPNKETLVIGGDFNEPKLAPFNFSWRNRRILHMRTGSFNMPTWFKRADKNSLFRANPDKLFWSKRSRLILQKVEILPTHTSDHRPIVARFLLSPVEESRQ